MLTRPPSFRAVAAFEAAARHVSFSKAADELNLTQSAISHAIRSLELRLGARLFTRAGRNVVLTPDGAHLARRVRESLALLAEAFDRRSVPERTHLIIGIEPGLASRLLARRLGAFMALQPQIAIQLKSAASAAALTAGQIDLAIRAGPEPDLGVCSRVIARDQLWPVAAPSVARGYDLADCGDLPRIESHQHPWSLWFAPGPRWASFRASAIVVDSDILAIEMAKAGEGICLAPSLLVERELAEASLARLGRDQAPAQWPYSLDRNPASAKLDEIALFAAWLTEALTSVYAEPAVTSNRAPRAWAVA